MWSSWPCVRTTATMSSSRSGIGVKSGRIRSTPGWLSSGNSTPQSMTSSRPGVLEDGHVPADLAETAEGDDAQAALRERRRRRRARGAGGSSRSLAALRRRFGRWFDRCCADGSIAHSSPLSPRSARSWSTSASVAATSGSRMVRSGQDAGQLQRGLHRDRSLGAGHDDRVTAGIRRAWISRARRPGRPRRRRAPSGRTRRPATWLTTLTTPAAPLGEPGEVQRVVAAVVRQVGRGHHRRHRRTGRRWRPSPRRSAACSASRTRSRRPDPDRRCGRGCRRASRAGRWRRRSR